MCSWCWGFAPTLERLRAEYPELELQLILGGLRPGPYAQALDDNMREYLRHHWQAVQQASGQAFNDEVLSWQDWRYDTEPACRAVVSMRQLAPDATLPFFTRLQRAFYAEAIDVTVDSSYPDLVEAFGVDSHTFIERFHSDGVKQATWQDFSLSRSLGVQGFPSLLLVDEGRYQALATGFTPFSELEKRLERAAKVLTQS